MDYNVGMQVRVVAVPHGYCSPRIGDVLMVTGVMDHGVMATTHMGLVKHGTLGQDGYHLFFSFNTIEPVVEDMGKTLKELNVKPGDVVKCVGYIDGYNCDWWTVGKTYAVTADGTPADNDGHTYGKYDDPQPAILFTVISRATDQEKGGPMVEDEGKTLKELDVKPGDIVGFKGADDDSWVVQEDFSVFSNQLFETIYLGENYWKHTKGFKIISRAKNTPTSETGTLKELNVKPGDVVEFISCEYNPTQYFYPEEPRAVVSNSISSVGVSVCGIYPEFDHAIWKVVSRAGEAKVQKEEEPELKIGDKVLVVKNDSYHGFAIGQVVTYAGGEVVTYAGGVNCMCFKDSEGNDWCMGHEEFVKVADGNSDNTEVFYGFDGIGFFDVEHPCYDERLVLNHTTGAFMLERI